MALGWRGQYFRYREFFLNIVDLYKKRADLRAFLEIVLSISTIIAFAIFALKPTTLTIISLIKEIDGKKATIAALGEKINNLSTAQNVYADNQNRLDNVDIAIATKPEPDAIAKQAIGLAAKDSVTIQSLSVSQITLIGSVVAVHKNTDLKPLPGDAKEMPVSLSVRGDYGALLAFINDFQNLRIISKIDLVSISSSENNGKKTVTAVISARVPFTGN